MPNKIEKIEKIIPECVKCASFMQWFKMECWDTLSTKEKSMDELASKVFDYFKENKETKALIKEIEEFASDPPLESNERRRGFHLAIEGVLKITKKYNKED